MTRRQVRYGPPSAERVLGALPVVAGFCRRLDVAGIAGRACPVRDIAHATHGQVIEALVASRLTSPAPLVHVEDWARARAVEEILSVRPEFLNDDRIGRALTSISLFGAYASPDHDYIEPRFGHPKDRRPDLLQVQAGLAVSADGGIPLWHRAYDGGAGEVAQRRSRRGRPGGPGDGGTVETGQ